MRVYDRIAPIEPIFGLCYSFILTFPSDETLNTWFVSTSGRSHEQEREKERSRVKQKKTGGGGDWLTVKITNL